MPHSYLHQHRGLLLLHGLWSRFHGFIQRTVVWRCGIAEILLLRPEFTDSPRSFSCHRFHCSVTYYSKNTAVAVPVQILAVIPESFTAGERVTRWWCLNILVCPPAQMWMNARTASCVWEVSAPTQSAPTAAPVLQGWSWWMERPAEVQAVWWCEFTAMTSLPWPLCVYVFVCRHRWVFNYSGTVWRRRLSEHWGLLHVHLS